jgi:hypothetical protein
MRAEALKMFVETVDPLSWCPGLDNAAHSLASVYHSMPKDAPGAIPWYVRLLENPKSPFALAGAIDLFGHDCIHAVLGRGLLPQDEAFVIGFTMGRAGACPRWHASLFRWCAEHLYAKPYRFSPPGARHRAELAARAVRTGSRALAPHRRNVIFPRPSANPARASRPS